MLKYGDINIINNGNSKSLIPRNLTYKNILNNTTTNNLINGSTTNSNTSTTGNFTSATITDLNVSSLNIVSNSLTPNIVISSPIAFSVLKSDYSTNDFITYPIYFSRDIFINNTNFKIETENLTIKDNVFMINSKSINVATANNTTDNVVSGFIFPISDNNTSTGFYSGLLYLPNNKIQQTAIGSSTYKWSNNNYNYFSNINKGFFKLKYLPQNLDFSKYKNTLNSDYVDLVENNNNLANLQVSALACGDGEIISINNQFLTFKISDGINLPHDTITIDKTSLNLLNNLSINFIDNLLIKNNKTTFINIHNNSIDFLNDINLNKNNFNINFNDIINFISNNKTLFSINSITNQIEILSTTFVNDIKINSSLELNNIPIKFSNVLQFIANNIVFLNLDSVNNIIYFYQPTTINTLNINTSFNLKNNIPIIFSNYLNIVDSNKNYLQISAINNNINLYVPTTINGLTVNTNFNINIPITFNTNFIVQTTNKQLLNIDINNTNLYNNLYFNNSNSSIKFNNKLNIANANTTLSITNGVNITGPTNGYIDISNVIVNPTLIISNTSIQDYTNTYAPIVQTFVLSKLSEINNNIIFTCNGVANNNLMSGTIIGTTRSFDNLISMYNIKVWMYIDATNNFNVMYDTIAPINTTFNGDWSINDIYLTQPNMDGIFNLNISCKGSSISRVVWGFKVELLTV